MVGLFPLLLREEEAAAVEGVGVDTAIAAVREGARCSTRRQQMPTSWGYARQF